MTRIAALSLSRLPAAMSLSQLALLILMLLAIPVAAFAHDGTTPWHVHPPGRTDLALSLGPWIAGAFLLSVIPLCAALAASARDRVTS